MGLTHVMAFSAPPQHLLGYDGFRMISARMTRRAKVLLISGASIAVALTAAACGTERIGVPASSPLHNGAVLFSQRCAGCHTLSYAATHGSASNVRTAQANNGPNFNVRCERPLVRVLYAIENGGFSGAIMPQNVVVGQDAVDVAKFVATYSGRQAPKVPGVLRCNEEPIGTLASATATAATTSTRSTATRATKGRRGRPAAKGRGGKANAAHP